MLGGKQYVHHVMHRLDCGCVSGELLPHVLEAFSAWVKLAGLPDSDASALCSHPLVRLWLVCL